MVLSFLAGTPKNRSPFTTGEVHSLPASPGFFYPFVFKKRKGKQPKCLSTDEWIKMWYVYIHVIPQKWGYTLKLITDQRGLEKHEYEMQCDVMDWILGHKENDSGKAGEMESTVVFSGDSWTKVRKVMKMKVLVTQSCPNLCDPRGL